MAAAVTSVVACAPDPRMEGGPSQEWSPAPTAPEQSEEAAEATRLVAELRAEARALADAASGWSPAEDLGQWADAIAVMTETHLARLCSTNLFTEPDPVLEAPEPEIAAPAGDAAAAHQWFTDTVGEHVSALAGLVTSADTQPEAMLFTSLALAAAGTRSRSVLPEAGDAAPLIFPDVAEGPSINVALTHAWALLRGLEIGVGRVTDTDVLHDLGTGRIASVRAIRNRLRDASPDVPEQPFAWEMPTPMNTPDEIREGWGVLEENFLDALARLFVATRDKQWLDLAVSQIGSVQATGHPLPHWPGWAEV